MWSLKKYPSTQSNQLLKYWNRWLCHVNLRHKFSAFYGFKYSSFSNFRASQKRRLSFLLRQILIIDSVQNEKNMSGYVSNTFFKTKEKGKKSTKILETLKWPKILFDSFPGRCPLFWRKFWPRAEESGRDAFSFYLFFGFRLRSCFARATLDFRSRSSLK